MAELLALFGYAAVCFLLNKAGVQNNIGPVSANLLTIPLNSNGLPSGVIGDACNHERKTHNEAKAQKEMRENEARQAREDERAERRFDEITVEEGLRKAQEIGILLRPDVVVVNRPSAPAPQPRVENGHVISAQARVNAVNQVASVVSSGAAAVANAAVAVGNAYIQGSKDMANTRRMEAQATQQLVSNVASAVGNAYIQGSIDMVNTRRMEAQATNQLIKDNLDNIITCASLGVDVASKNHGSVVQTVVTEVIAKENDKFNQRGDTEKKFDTTLGTIALTTGFVAMVSPEPVTKITAGTVAVAAGGILTAKESLKMIINVDDIKDKNTLPEHRQVVNGLLSD